MAPKMADRTPSSAGAGPASVECEYTTYDMCDACGRQVVVDVVFKDENGVFWLEDAERKLPIGEEKRRLEEEEMTDFGQGPFPAIGTTIANCDNCGTMACRECLERYMTFDKNSEFHEVPCCPKCIDDLVAGPEVVEPTIDEVVEPAIAEVVLRSAWFERVMSRNTVLLFPTEFAKIIETIIDLEVKNWAIQLALVVDENEERAGQVMDVSGNLYGESSVLGQRYIAREVMNVDGDFDDEKCHWYKKITRWGSPDDPAKPGWSPYKTRESPTDDKASLYYTPHRMLFDFGRLPMNQHVRAEQFCAAEKIDLEDQLDLLDTETPRVNYWWHTEVFDRKWAEIVPNPFADAPSEFAVGPYEAVLLQNWWYGGSDTD